MNTHIIIMLSVIVCTTCPPPATIKYREIITRQKAAHNFLTLLRKMTTTFQKKVKVSITANRDKESLDGHDHEESDEFFSHEHSIDDDVRMYFINKKYPTPKPISAANFREVIQSDVADLPLKVLINGWSSDNRLFYQTLIPAYINPSALLKVNVLLVDWTALDRENNYPKSSLITAVVGQKVAAMLGTLVKNRVIQSQHIHLIGYSMGAHVAATVGEKLKTGLGAPTVGRITGLDPVYPCVEGSVVDKCLDKSHGVFVDVIHTFTTHEFGRPPVGTVDFYLKIDSDLRTKTTRSNLLETNELKTVELFSESIKNIKVVQCCNWEDFSLSSCNDNKVIVMGEHANEEYRGKFYCHLPTKASAKVEM
ncbi:hepatic triacylglycerol lipase-like isoform X2 [Adelges cooleyi]|uniref:hepatic triacylglycerol lipase-like isoform X2 n=1 Tax=Adelges cooleyi TaxID=133065 RepID=UPI00217FD2D2|nr:hepatic triacylglycerol lipase-like isoform X2 [Adelges cooleyi]